MRNVATTDILEASRMLSSKSSKLRERLITKSSTTRNTATKNTTEIEERKSVHYIGSQLKHLVDTPEVLHGLLDTLKVYDATVRYLTAQDAYQALKESTELHRFTKFAKRRLRLVNAFQQQLASCGKEVLCKKDLSSEKYGEAIVACAFMDNWMERKGETTKTDDESIPTAFENLLVAKSRHVELLLEQEVTGVSLQKKVEEIMVRIMDTVTLSFELFRSGGIIEKLLEGAPTCQDVLGIPSLETVGESVVSWLSVIKLKVLPGSDGSNVLSEAQSCSTLSECYQSIRTICSKASWTQSVDINKDMDMQDDSALQAPKEIFSVPASTIQEILTPAMECQASVLIKQYLQKCTDTLLEQMQSIRENENEQAAVKSMLHVGSTNESLERMLCLEDEAHTSGEHSPVVDKYLEQISSLQRDVMELSESIWKVNEIFREELAARLDFVVAELLPKKELSASAALSCAKIASRLAEAGALKKAYLARPRGGREDSSRHDDEKKFATLAATLLDTADGGYRTWAKGIVQEMKGDLSSALDSDLLAVAHGWESCNDPGSVRVPAAGSAAVIEFILRGCTACENAHDLRVSNGIDRAARAINSAMMDLFCQVYSKEVERVKNSDKLNGSMGERKNIRLMQMLFDVRMMISGILAANESGGEEEEQRRASFTELEKTLCSCLDSVDLAAGDKKIHKNVELFLQRSCLLFGMVGNCKNDTQGSTDASGDAVVLRQVVPRFAYLPAPLPSTYVAKVRVGRERKRDGKKAVEKASDVGAYAQRITEGIFGSKLFNSIARVGQ